MCMWYTFRVQSNVESQSSGLHAQREVSHQRDRIGYSYMKERSLYGFKSVLSMPSIT